jgi:SNF2 family DNA or RNA helicase
MGLGKTLTMLTIIAWSLNIVSTITAKDKINMSRPTLIIALKSNMSGWIDQIKE